MLVQISTCFSPLITIEHIKKKKSLISKLCKNFAVSIGESCPAELDIFLVYYALEPDIGAYPQHRTRGTNNYLNQVLKAK